MTRRPTARAHRAPVVRTVAVDEIGAESTLDEVGAWLYAHGWSLRVDLPTERSGWSARLTRNELLIVGTGASLLSALLDAVDVTRTSARQVCP